MKNLFKCQLCKEELDSIESLSVHFAKKHSDEKIKDYYDQFLKKHKDDGKCIICGKDALFKNVRDGYDKICSSKECLGKIKTKGTPEYLMYKYGLSQEEAIALHNKRKAVIDVINWAENERNKNK